MNSFYSSSADNNNPRKLTFPKRITSVTCPLTIQRHVSWSEVTVAKSGPGGTILEFVHTS